ELLVSSSNEVFRRKVSNSSTSATTFESIQSFDSEGMSAIYMASVADGSQVYLLVDKFVHNCEVYRLDDSGLSKMPYEIKGMMSSMQRWFDRVVRRSLIIIAAGVVLLTLIAALLAGESSYSFGHDSVQLATLFRRFGARTFDFGLMSGPLVAQLTWIFFHKFN